MDEKGKKATFLHSERRPDETRSFKLIEANPLQTSYGDDLYEAIFSDEERKRHRRPELIA